MVLVATNTAPLNSEGTVTIRNTTITSQYPAITAKVVPNITISSITPGTTQEPASSGDIVFYIDSNADPATSCNQVKVAAKEAAAGAVAQVWASEATYQTAVIPAPGAQYPSDGSINTVATVQAEGTGTPEGRLDDANVICLNYTETTSGFTNWYLPAICELGSGVAGCSGNNNMYEKISALGTVPATLNVLWSSTENNATSAWLQETSQLSDTSKQAPYFKALAVYSDQSSIGVWCARSYTASSP